MLSNYWVFASLLLITALLVRKHLTKPFSLFGTKSAPVHSINNPAIKLGSMTGVHSIQGCRSHMEDAYFADWTTGFFAVFDGHGGYRASQFASRYLHELFMKHLSNDSKTDQAKKVTKQANKQANLNHPDDVTAPLSPRAALEHSFLELDRLWLESAALNQWDDGSTCVAVYIHDGTLYVANVGDSRAVLVTSSGAGIDLSSDHKPSRVDEKDRIESLGGRIIHYGTWRVEGVLAVTRAIGDRKLKRYVTALPELKVRPLSSSDSYLILASDGVWDVLTSQQAAQIVQQSANVKQAAINLTQAAYQRQSQDNITSIVIDLKSWR